MQQSFVLSVCLTIILLAGCGKRGTPTYPVSGKVTVDGNPVNTGDILFVPQDSKHGPNAGKINDGQFRFEAIAGQMRVEIRALRPIPGAQPVLGEYPQENFLPDRYHAESTLTANVTPEGPNDFSFELTTKKR